MRDADQSTFDVGATVAAASRHCTMPSRNAASTAASTDRIDAHATISSSPRLAWCPLHRPHGVIALWHLPAFRICWPTQYGGQPSNGTSS
ncbi:hypothetical protein WI44_05385 [Burkholderia cepacia]|nr:hypothetical protein WI44_05385 [Burkholderia cepacia]KVA48456.1 hypothetical protein WI45_07145 [Burkholderia cepacia]